MATIDEIPQIINRGRLVLDQDQDEVEAESCECLAVAILVNCADVGDALYGCCIAWSDKRAKMVQSRVLT